MTAHLLKYPARYFLLIDQVYKTAWEEDNATLREMVSKTRAFAELVHASNYAFIRTPQGGFAPGIFEFKNLIPNLETWTPVDGRFMYTPRLDTPSGIRMLDLIAELPSCMFMKTLSVAGIDNVANMALPPNQVLAMGRRLYLVWYAPKEVGSPFGTGALELEHEEFKAIYAEHLLSCGEF